MSVANDFWYRRVGSNERRTGNAYDEWFTVEGRKNTIDGAGGYDVADYSSVNVPFRVRPGTDTSIIIQARDGSWSDTVKNVEHIVFTSTGYDTDSYGQPVPLFDLAAVRFDTTVEVLRSGMVRTGYGDDVVIGGVDDIYAVTGSGNDLIVLRSRSGEVHGGAGEDTVSYEHDDQGVTLRLAETFGSQIRMTGVENVIGGSGADDLRGDDLGNLLDGGDGDDQIQGLGGADRLFGGAGQDTLIAGRGDDRVRGGDGADQLAGEAGIDTVDYADATADVVVDLAEGIATGGAGNDQISGFENAVGSAFADDLRGDLGVNVLTGGNGDDRLAGRDGDDLLTGGDGADLLLGDAGNDTFRVQGDTHVGDYIHGGAGTDILAGTAADDVIRLRRLSEVERIDGGDGRDIITSEDGRALGLDLSQALVRNIEEIQGSALDDLIIGSGTSDLVLGGRGADRLRGHGGEDLLNGGHGNDQIAGGAGDDRLVGGLGADVLEGGSGSDLFDINAVAESAGGLTDRIDDFRSGEDRLDFTTIDAVAGTARNDAFVYLGRAEFDGAAGRLRYALTDTTTRIEADIDGDRVADLRVDLTGRIELTQTDFLL